MISQAGADEAAGSASAPSPEPEALLEVDAVWSGAGVGSDWKKRTTGLAVSQRLKL